MIRTGAFTVLFSVLIALFGRSASAYGCQLGEQRRAPNILFIMSDDHTTQAIGAYGSRLAGLNPTPTIDALARNGMRFDRVFCNNSIYTPSRASIITGQYPQRNGVLDLRGNIPPERQFLPIELRKAGYQTAMIGKWHLKKEPAAFDYYCVLPGQGDYFDPEFRIRGSKPWPGNLVMKEGKHSSDAGEMNNLYRNPAYQEHIAKLKIQFKTTRKALGETDTKYPAIQRVIDSHWEQ